MIRFLTFLLLVNLASYGQDINQKSLKKHVKFLASDRLEGRGTGTRGEQLAGDYIIKNFQKVGLGEYPGVNGFRQEFIAKKGNSEVTSNNIIGYLDNGKPYTIIIGAHYDHLGLGDQGSSLEARPDSLIHNGADDNASGIAGLLELAKHFSQNRKSENFNFIFAAFSGEELGLLGSKYMSEHTGLDPAKINLMINMDMIGRYREDKGLTIGGIGTSKELAEIAPELSKKAGLKFNVDSSGVGPSDHTSFYLKDIPVLFLFTGAHAEYHKPTDDARLINYKGIARISNYVIDVVNKLEQLPKLEFKKTSNPHARGNKRSSFKVSMGVIPDYSFGGPGLKIDGVADGKPAEKAGVIAGDILMKVGSIEIKDIYSYMDILNKHEKGETVPVEVVRKGTRKTLSLTF